MIAGLVLCRNRAVWHALGDDEMSKIAGLFAGQGAVATVGAVAIGATVIGGGYFSGWFSGDEPQVQTAGLTPPKVTVVVQEPAKIRPKVAPKVQKPAKAADPEPAVAEPAPDAGNKVPGPVVTTTVAPSFDLVRVDAEGMATIAGKAAARARVALLLDGRVVEQTDAGAEGAFAMFVALGFSDNPRMLQLKVDNASGAVMSDDQVIVAPVAKPEKEPVLVAKAEPKPQAPAPKAPEAKAPEPEPAAPAVFLADKSGVRLVQPPVPKDVAPKVMSNVALDAISYSETGDVQLAGRARGRGFVRVYLDNKPITTSRIASGGNWRTDLPDVDTGIYTLRVDEVNASGKVTSRVETPFKRESKAKLAATVSSKGQTGDSVPSAPVRAITVQPGTTLWAIARDVYGDGVMYVRVFEANKERIRNPDLIYPGQIFDLPKE